MIEIKNLCKSFEIADGTVDALKDISLLYNPDGSEQKVVVTSNVDWTVATEGGSGWLTVTPNSGNGNNELTVTASENTGSALRGARFTYCRTYQEPQ